MAVAVEKMNVEDVFGKNLDAKDLVSLARVAEAAERYTDMCQIMRELVLKKVKENEELETEERNLLSVAYKNVVGSKRSSWRTLSGGNFNDVDKDVVENYKNEVESQLKAICEEVLELLEKSLLPTVENKNDETEVFYKKMCGDYYRYLAEFLSTDGDDKYKQNTEKFYADAFKVSKACLPETHPTRLGLALNFSVCYYEILKKKEEACKLAKEAFDAAIEKLDTLNDASYKDSTLIMQLLKDNLTLWNESDEHSDGDIEVQEVGDEN